MPGRERTAVIGVGGGRDILSAAVFGSRDITEVEINPTFVRLLTRAPGFVDFAKLDKVPGVKLVIDEGRSWFAQTSETFDLIQMSLIDTWAATGAGAFSLSENGLYTVEAWKIFLGPAVHLLLSASSREALFFCSLWNATLLEVGWRSWEGEQ